MIVVVLRNKVNKQEIVHVAATQQTQAIQNANQVMALGAGLLNLVNQITAVNNAWQDDSSLTVVNALATAVQNADGSLGAADATINNAHPIDTRVAANSTLSHAVPANTIASVLTQLNNIAAFVNNGTAIAATPGVRSVLNQVSGG